MGITARAFCLAMAPGRISGRTVSALPPFPFPPPSGVVDKPPRIRGALVAPPAPRFQQTRFQRQIAQVGSSLERWATNPWRRLSLLLIMLLAAMVVGGGLGSITGALSYFDPISAMACVLLIELAVRLRPGLLAGRQDRLVLQLLDMARIGLLWGLMLDGFKLL